MVVLPAVPMVNRYAPGTIGPGTNVISREPTDALQPILDSGNVHDGSQNVPVMFIA